MATPLITRSGYEKLQQEFNDLWRIERPEVTKIVAWAASLGDRSENADYQYNKKKLREIDRRLRYLKRQLEHLKIVDYHHSQDGKVYFGAWVDLLNAAEQTLTFRIVGPDEIFHDPNYVSIDAPISRACLQKTVGEEISVSVPGEPVAEWEITAIRYRA